MSPATTTTTTTFLLFSLYQHDYHRICNVSPLLPPPHFNCFFSTTCLLISLHQHHIYCFLFTSTFRSRVFSTPPPHFYRFSFNFTTIITTTLLMFPLHHRTTITITFLLLSLQHHRHHISIFFIQLNLYFLFSTPPPIHLHCFNSTSTRARLFESGLNPNLGLS